jgi:hypothetical protein
MAIEVACQCGKRFGVAGEYAGKRIRCPGCRGAVLVPFVNVFVPKTTDEPAPEVAPAATPPKRPFWRDPVVLIGGSVPTLILAIFFGYLHHEKQEQEFRDRIYGWKAKADRHWAAGETMPAYEAYKVVVQAFDIAPRKDTQLAATVDSARGMVGKLEPLVVELAKVGEAKRKQEREDAEKLAAKLAEERRLAAITADVSGTAWAEFKSGNLDTIRGLEIYFVPAEVKRRDAKEILGALAGLASMRSAVARSLVSGTEGKARKEAEGLAKGFESEESKILGYVNDEQTETVESAKLYAITRLLQGSDTRLQVLQDRIWPEFLASITPRKTETSISGKYRIEGLKGGSYRVYALHWTEKGVMEWMTPFAVDKAGELTCDLHNRKAMIIINDVEKSE